MITLCCLDPRSYAVILQEGFLQKLIPLYYRRNGSLRTVSITFIMTPMEESLELITHLVFTPGAKPLWLQKSQPIGR
jgi:hypothetical protein